MLLLPLSDVIFCTLVCSANQNQNVCFLETWGVYNGYGAVVFFFLLFGNFLMWGDKQSKPTLNMSISRKGKRLSNNSKKLKAQLSEFSVSYSTTPSISGHLINFIYILF